MTTYQNIALCQINVQAGQQEYYLPHNASWADKKIEKIVLYTDYLQGIKSPVDGQSVIAFLGVGNLFFDLFNKDGENIVHNAHAGQFLATNNYPLEINEKLSYELSRLYFTNAPAGPGALMLYIFYNSEETGREEKRENVTVSFDLAAGERMTFDHMIEHYLYTAKAGIRHITVWSGSTQNYNQGYITLRDINNRLSHENIPTFFFRPQYQLPADPYPFFANTYDLSGVELDFNNSWIVNGLNTTQHFCITFHY